MSNVQAQMPNKVLMPKYDLEQRTSSFAMGIIDFAKQVPRSILLDPLISQSVRSGTSVAANYMEADAALSKRDFRCKIAICRKEAKETKHWLRMITHTNNDRDSSSLSREASELVLIFSAILKSSA